MVHKLNHLNSQPPTEAQAEFLKCCGSQRWASRMTEARPFASLDELKQTAERIWWSLLAEDWLEAFRSHPQIGGTKHSAGNERKESLSQEWSEQEQSGVSSASSETIKSLAELNRQYEEKFGFIFIVCATGKSSDELLLNLRKRLGNPGEKELHIAAAEQARITTLRLEKLLNQ
ncbi:MAG TPA: 2-oxo-4-hydroxy-4-carboxy-5-ureidoimidazoline decarboxylase [Pyrinomonadaceae bacterium]|nr:2-oxo-4-hydroxy-4-carboxy-5-ureidoimidazoline decarboxylase [Pyrinomonadaceae bacterium]